jgi:predicted Zn-dependent peptidase
MPHPPARRALGLLACALLGLGMILTAVPARGQEAWPEVRRHVLDNGLTLLMVERRQAPVVAANVTVRVGAVDEPEGQTGLAHLFEHMAFKGTRRIGTRNASREKALLDQMDDLVEERAERIRAGADPRELTILNLLVRTAQQEARKLVVPNAYANLYMRQGAVGLNASTSSEVTRYYVRLPANRLPFWAAMEYERLADPVLREFYVERDVVTEERRTRVDTSPAGRLTESFLATAFLAHPYGRPVLGWPSDLRRLTRPKAEAFYRAHYVPANMVVALVGDLDPDATLRLVERTLGRLPARAPAPRPATREPEPDGERRVVQRGNAAPSLVMGYLRPALTDPDDAVFDVIHDVLAGGPTSRLYRRLVLEDAIATSVSTSEAPGLRDPHLFLIEATPRQPHTPAEVEASILEELARLGEEPVTERDIERARNRVEAVVVRALEDNDGLASNLAYFEAVAGDWHYLIQGSERLARVTPEDVRRVAAAYLVPDRRVTGERLRTGDADPDAGTPGGDPEPEPAAW